MSTQMITQTTFTFGETDETTWKRTEVQEYLTAAQSLLNCEVGTTGLAKKRKGMTLLYNATGKAQFNSRMYEFVDNNGNYYVLLSAAGHVYVFQTPSTQVQVVTSRGTNVVINTGANVVAFANNLTSIQDIPTPYQTGDLDGIDYTQDNDALILTHPNYAPAKIYISAYNGSAPPTFAFEYLIIYPLPAYDFGKVNYAGYTVTQLTQLLGVLTFKISNPSGAATGFTTAWIGGEIVGGGSSVDDPIGYAIITNVTNAANVTTFTGRVQVTFDSIGFSAAGSQYSIKEPVWVAPASPFPAPNPVVAGYPAKVLFFQSRLWFANTSLLNNTIFGSKINSPINFDVGIGRDTDAIVYTIGQTNSRSILWLNGGKQLEIFCENSEFACPQDVNTALTPSTFSIRQQSSYGTSPLLKPLTYINDSYYLTKTGKGIINFHFSGVGLTYVSTNISAASAHLVKNPTNRALLRGSDTSQDNFIYFLNPDDDTITTFQFANELKLAALTPAVFEDDVQLVDIATIDNSVYVLKFYELTEQYTIEAFDDAVRTDCTFTANMASSGLVTGLDLLDGYTVQVVHLGQDFGQYLVENNQITVYNPDEIADTVFIGLLYDVDITPMYTYAGPNAEPLFKKMTRIYVDYYQSLDFSINGKLVPYQTYTDIQAGLPPQPQTDTAIIDPVLGYGRFQTFSITQSSPFDLQILGIRYQIHADVI